MRIRFLHTEAFRLSAIYAAIFAASMLVLGAMTLLITDRAFHDQGTNDQPEGVTVQATVEK